jgi:hypothetical protein
MSVSQLAKSFYDSELRATLESQHNGKYVAIEPSSRSFYVAQTFVEAAMQAKAAHPKHKIFVIRIGYEAAVHIGAVSS